MDDTIPFIKLVDGSSRNKKHEGDEAKVREGLMQPVSFPCFATCPQRRPRLLLGLRFRLEQKALCLLRHAEA